MFRRVSPQREQGMMVVIQCLCGMCVSRMKGSGPGHVKQALAAWGDGLAASQTTAPVDRIIAPELAIDVALFFDHMTWDLCINLQVPLTIHPKGSGPPFCSYKTQGLEKSLQNDWVLMNVSLYKMVGPCASTTSFHHPSILYGGILSPDVRFLFSLNVNFACMLGSCAPKKAPFCKNLFLYHSPSFFSIQ